MARPETRRRVLAALEGGQQTASQVAQSTGSVKSVVHKALQQLADAHLVVRLDPAGRKWVYYRITHLGTAALGRDSPWEKGAALNTTPHHASDEEGQFSCDNPPPTP